MKAKLQDAAWLSLFYGHPTKSADFFFCLVHIPQGAPSRLDVQKAEGAVPLPSMVYVIYATTTAMMQNTIRQTTVSTEQTPEATV